MRLPLTLACGLYDRTLLLQNGMVQPEGIDLNFIELPAGELFRRQARHAEFDVAEFALGTHVLMSSRGDSRHVGIPVFPVRKFRHADIYVNTNAGIREPTELAGKRVGATGYQQTAGIWIRGLLEQQYGLKPQDVEWVFGNVNETGGHQERVPIDLPTWLRSSWISAGQSLDQMLDDGEIDAYLGARTPDSYRRQSPNVARLFPDFMQVESEYYRRTGIFPIMHTVVLKRECYERAPWAARSIYKAFLDAQAGVASRFEHGGTLFCALPWLHKHLEERDSLPGGNPFIDGMEENRHVLEEFIQFEVKQGLIETPPSVDDLFASETHSRAI